MDAVQQDFGGFNPAFLGVSIAVGSRRTLELIIEDVNDRSMTASELMQLSHPDAFAAAATLTVLAHEIRHFHDYLISPVGSFTYWNRLFASIAASQLLIVLIQEHDRHPFNCLPVPLPRWLRRTPDERALLIGRWNRVLADQGHPALVVPELADIVLETAMVTLRSNYDLGARQPYQLTPWLDSVDRRYERLRRVSSVTHQVGDRLITPAHLFEASAIVVQTAEVAKAYGPAGLALFLHGLGLAGQRSLYTDIIDLFAPAVLARLGNELTLAQLSAAVQWCLLGDPLAHSGGQQIADNEIVSTSAATRFARLWGHLRDHGFRAPSRPGVSYVAQLFREWDQLLGDDVSSLDDLRASARRDEKLLARLIGLFENDRDGGERFHLGATADVLPAARQFVDARRWCVDRYLEDPDTYVMPLSYLDSLEILECAPIKLNFNSTFSAYGEFVNDIYLSRKNDEGQEVPLIVEPAFKTAGIAHLTARDVFDLYTRFVLADVLYSEFGRDRIDQNEYLMVRQAMFKSFAVRFVNA